MQVAYFPQPKKVEFLEVPRSEPGPGEVRLRMKMFSICGSDVHLYKGDWQERVPYPVRPGHEGVGIVDAIGEGVTHLAPGQRVVIEPNIPCGQCHYCLRGQGNICPKKRIIGVAEPGCFAEYSIFPASFAWPIPAHIPDEEAVLVEPTAVGWHALRVASLRPGDTIAVIGLGAIGLLLTHVALAVGYRVIVMDRIPEKMSLAQQWGATIFRLQDGGNIIPQVAMQMETADVVAVFECGGTPKTAELALSSAPRGSKIVIVGLAHEPVLFIPFDITRRGINILTSMIYDHPADFSRVIELISNGTIQPSKVISRRCQFVELPEALSLAASGMETKIVLEIE